MLDHDCDILPGCKYRLYFNFYKWSGSPLCLLRVLFTMWFGVQAFLNLEVVALANFPLRPSTCLQSFHLWAAPRPTEHSPSVTLIRRLVRNKRERETPFHLFSFSSADFCRTISRAENPPWHESEFCPLKKEWETVDLLFFPMATSIIVWPPCFLWSWVTAVN